MQPLQPDQAAFLLQVNLPTLKNEYRTTKKVLEAIPEDKGDYRPAPNCMSALDLAWHIAAAENMFLAGVISGAFTYGGARPDSVRTPADVVRWYSETFETNFDALTRLSADELMRTVDFRGMFQHPAVMYLGFSMHHSIHHRGQLSAYLRPMGAKVPSIYGESYDDRQARTAAQA
jgi:uncharacterized damage-inducible protein DinB